MTQIRIETYHRDYLAGLVACFNDETDFEAHIAPLTPQRFIDLVEQKSYFDPTGLLVALEEGQVIGWVHACLAAGSEPGHKPDQKKPRIRMLIFPRHRLKVGQALVHEATNWLKKSGQLQFLALHAQVGYPFYRGLWLGGEPMGPVTLPHQQLALEVGGYKNTQESIFLTAAMPLAPPEHAATVAIEFETAGAVMAHQPMAESWIGFSPMRTKAWRNGEEAGTIGWVILPYLDRLGAPAMNIWGLGVKEPYRRQGIASALISQAMRQSYGLGARFASVGTQLWNGPAHASYAKFGYQPHCVLVGRTLNLVPAEEQK
jgi:GNAT superfamily N-acetyltransferase